MGGEEVVAAAAAAFSAAVGRVRKTSGIRRPPPAVWAGGRGCRRHGEGELPVDFRQSAMARLPRTTVELRHLTSGRCPCERWTMGKTIEVERARPTADERPGEAGEPAVGRGRDGRMSRQRKGDLSRCRRELQGERPDCPPDLDRLPQPLPNQVRLRAAVRRGARRRAPRPARQHFRRDWRAD